MRGLPLQSTVFAEVCHRASLPLNREPWQGWGDWLGAADFHSYILSYVRYKATSRSGNHSSLHPRGYCEHLEEKAGRGCQSKLHSHPDKLPLRRSL